MWLEVVIMQIQSLHDYISSLSAKNSDGIRDGQKSTIYGDSGLHVVRYTGSFVFEVRQVMLFLWLMLDVDNRTLNYKQVHVTKLRPMFLPMSDKGC